MTEVNPVDQTTTETTTTSAPADAKTFTQADVDRIIAERLKRAEEAATKKALEKLGVENLDSAAEVLKKAKEREEADMSELDKLRKQIEDLSHKNKTHVEQILSMQRQRLYDARDTAIKSALTTARATNPDRVFTLLNAERKAELEAVMSESGELDPKAIDKLVKEAVKEYAEFFRSQSPGSPSNAGGTPPSADKERVQAALAQRKRITL
jgi:small-conductance mechanosensitive channel